MSCGDNISIKLKNYVMVSFLLISLIPFLNNAESMEIHSKIDAYAGFDVSRRKMPFKKDFGCSVFNNSNYDELNIFTGLKINENLAVEIGREFSETKIEIRRNNSGSYFFGHRLPENIEGFDRITNSTYSESKISGYNINLMLINPLFQSKNISLISGVGAGYLKTKIRSNLTQTGETSISLENPSLVMPIQRENITKTKYNRKMPTIRLMGGFQHITKNSLGMRVLVSWENTHKIRIRGNDLLTGIPVNEHAKFKDSITYRAGFFVPF